MEIKNMSFTIFKTFILKGIQTNKEVKVMRKI